MGGELPHLRKKLTDKSESINNRNLCKQTETYSVNDDILFPPDDTAIELGETKDIEIKLINYENLYK